jgi:tetratricopeptide (TPR) repeat protein/tRNA A-37 threonylcarbamoyl transferase component Bud32
MNADETSGTGPRDADEATLDLSDATVGLGPSLTAPAASRPSAEALPAGSADLSTVDLHASETVEIPTQGRPSPRSDDPDATQEFSHGPASDPRMAATIAQTVDRAAQGGASPGFFVPPSAGTDGSRFQIVRPHARGGLGEVFIALDQELRREVALKEIQERHADDPVSRGRFVLEAEVTGGLEHPGIVPVYGLGQYRDGRPYYAMRFIRGESLKEAIDRFHQADAQPGRDPGERELSLRLLLRRFVDVCHAMDYAHSRGILHRDLKPANIMLGPYGETLVVDWGLAKPLDRAAEPAGGGLKPLRPMSASGTGQTLFGATVGTPHYMSPEQAEGRLDLMGPASDIYSLGATLYCLLTGSTPFQDRTLGQLLAKVRRGEFPPPRSVKRSVPPALEAITLKAMALKPEDRYGSARALADEIEHWMADEPVAAYREPWTARAARWARRHRTAVTTVAALLVTTVIGLSIATVLINRERARTETQRQLAQANFLLARDAVDNMLTELGAVDLVDIPQAEGVRRAMLVKARDFYAAFLKKHGDDPGLRQAAGQAFARAGDILEMLGDYDAAEASYRNAERLLRPLADGAERSAGSRRDLARVEHGLGVLLKKSLRFKEAETALKAAVALRHQLATETPGREDDQKAETDSVYQLGALYARQDGRSPDAQKLYDQAIAVRKKMVEDLRGDPEDRRMLARFLNNAGILESRTNPNSAEATFHESAAIQKALLARTPNVPSYRWEFARSRTNLGAILSRDRPAEALAEYDAAVTLFQGLAEEYPAVPDYRYELAVARANRGLLQIQQNLLDQAEDDLKEAERLLGKLSADHPGRPDFRVRLAEVRRSLGFLYQSSARLDHAADAYQLALASQRPVAEAHPDVPEYRSALGAILSQHAQLLAADPAKLEQAEPLLVRAIAEQEAALKGDAANTKYRAYLYDDLQLLALVRLRSSRFPEAVEAVEAMVRLRPDDPDTLCRAGRAIAVALQRIADDHQLDDSRRAELSRRFMPEALRLLREAVRRGMKDAKEFDHEDYRALEGAPEFRSLRESVRAGAFSG